MKATDLRIGNLLMCKEISQYPIPVYNIWSDGIIHFDWESMEGQTGAPIDRCEPIPLTSEWLEKAGFKEEWKNSGFLVNRTSGWPISIRPITKKRFLSDEPVEQPTWRMLDHVYVFYVHQLQNLYYALTGTELTLSLNKNA